MSAEVAAPVRGPVPRWVRQTGWYVLLSVLALLVLFPIYVTVIRAVSDPAAYVRAGAPLYPVKADWGVFGEAFSQGGLGSATLRSLSMALIVTAAQVITSILAAYAFVFLRFPFRKLMFAVFLSTLMLPLEVTFVANVTTIRQLHWIDSLQGLVAPFIATAFGTFLLRQAFAGIPPALREAAYLDGYGHLAFLRKVVVPLARPVVASLALIAFLSSWNQYLWPRAVIETPDKQVLQIALTNLATANVDRLNVGVAGAIVAAVPIAVLLVFFQRQIVRGLTAGAVKG